MVFQPASPVSVSLPALLNYPDASGNLSGTKLCFCPRTSAAGSGGRWLGPGWGLLEGPPVYNNGGGGSSDVFSAQSVQVFLRLLSSSILMAQLPPSSGARATPNTPPPPRVTSPTLPPTNTKKTHHVCLKDRLEGFLPPPLLKDGCWPDNTSPPC